MNPEPPADRPDTPRRLPGGAVTTAAAWTIALGTLAAFVVKIVGLPPELRIGYVPDDGYYYLLLARHFGESGRWTFDGGFTETSGFHLLFAYLLVPVSWAANAVGAEFDTLGLATTAVLAAAAWCAPLALAGRHRAAAAVGAAAVFVAWPSIANSVAIVEWPLVVAIDGTLVVLLVRSADESDRGAPRIAWFAALGFTASLARTDAGLWPVALAAAAWIVRRATGGPAPIRAALAASAGAVAGVLAATLHHAALSGSFVQSSVLVKSHWVSVTGGDFRRPVYLLEAMTAPLARPADGPLAATAIVLAAVAAVVVARRSGGGIVARYGAGPVTAFLGSVLAIAGYVVVYSRNGDVQPWYSAHFVAPVAVLFACGVGVCAACGVRWLAAASVVAMLALAGVRAADSLTRPPTWPHQADMMMAGALLRAEHPGERVAAWNAGVLSYHQGGTVVNLDGLVNNDAARAVVEGRLDAYLRTAGIAYVADSERMLTDPALRARGGYPGEFVHVRLRPEVVFDDALNRDWPRMTIYRVVAPEPGAGSAAESPPPRHVVRTPGSGAPLRWGYNLVESGR